MVLCLTTERLVIEPLGETDVAAFVAYRQDPDVARYQSWETSYDEAAASALVAAQAGTDMPTPDEWFQYAVRSADTRELLGDVAVRLIADQPNSYEIGFTLRPSAQGNGFATEAVRAMLSHLFGAANAHRVSASCDSRNGASARVLERAGLRQEARHHSADFFKGEWTTVDVFALLVAEYS